MTWDFDNNTLVYTTVTSFGTGAALGMDGLWVVNIHEKQSQRLENLSSRDEEILGWVDAETILLHSWSASCEYYGLRTYQKRKSFLFP